MRTVPLGKPCPCVLPPEWTDTGAILWLWHGTRVCHCERKLPAVLQSGLSSNHWWCCALADWRSNSQRVEGERRIKILKKQITVKLAPEMNLPDEHLRFERHTGQSPYLHCIRRVLARVLEHCTVDTSTYYTLHLKGRTFVQLTT